MPRGLLPLLCVTLTTAVQANTYRVDNNSNTGYRSLRWAIGLANASPGPDRITFNGALLGAVIKPTSELPAITDAATTVDGDINNDGRPDITLSGILLPTSAFPSGLEVKADNCLIEGLAIVRAPGAGLLLSYADGCRVRACHLGVNRAGTVSLTNGGPQLGAWDSNSNIIGEGSRPNFFSAGTTGLGGSSPSGLWIVDGQNNTIQYNLFNLTRTGDATLGNGAYGIAIMSDSGPAAGNLVRHNRFARLHRGVHLNAADANTIWGNSFGLAVDGMTPLPMTAECIRVDLGASDNRIGGATATARNVFVGEANSQGIVLNGTGTSNNRIQGNYFGTTADGSQRRDLRRGVVIEAGAGAQSIGGPTAASANHFVLRDPNATTGIRFAGGGSGTRVQNNVFGRLPAGADAGTTGIHVRAEAASGIRILDNLLARNTYGVYAKQGVSPTSIQFHGNTVRNCEYGVYLNASVSANLGNLGNPSTSDDGGNIFRSTNTWHIRNQSPNRVRAEGNDFGTTSKTAIDAKTWDRLDNPVLGRVDFDPLLGGVSPTGGTGGLLALTGTAAIPTAGGAEIVYSLSTPAEVTIEVLNLAGRPVASIVQNQASAGGLQHVLWNGRSIGGTAAPNGSYLVRITARSADGAQANAIAPLRLAR